MRRNLSATTVFAGVRTVGCEGQMRRLRSRQRPSASRGRSGQATLDHILVLAVTLPILTIVIPLGRRMIRAVWELTCLQVAWPFM